MANRHGAVHVATIRCRSKGRVYLTHLLRRTYRQDGKVKHETLGNISHLPGPVIEAIRLLMKGETLVRPEEAFVIERGLPHGHVAAVLGTLRRLGVEALLSSKHSRQRDLAVALIVARVIGPASKLATARGLAEATAASSLGAVLDIADADEDELYGAMDWLGPRQGRIETELAKRHLKDGSLVLYDVTSVWFEGTQCPLAAYGHSRDGKGDRLQIVVGLLCSAQGCPVAVEVFEGNTADPKTLATQIAKVRDRFGLRRVVLIGDRGMITEARLKEDIRPLSDAEAGVQWDWISALRAPALKKLAEAGEVQLGLFDERDLAEIASDLYPGERLVVCRNPDLAVERTRKRNELLAATEKVLDKIVAATRRKRQPLRGSAIGVRVGKDIGRFKMAKHFDLTITEDAFAYRRKEAAIAEESALDGIYVLRTNVKKDVLDAPGVVRAYKSLSAAERAFRSLKTVDLKIRPIYHHLAGRVRAHVLLCMLAYYVEWHMREALAPMLFDDEDPAAGEARRASAVQAAQRSEPAEHKTHTKKTQDGQPVHSFQTLLADLATLSRNRVRLKANAQAAFIQYTESTPIQQRAFDLLGVPFRL